MSENYDAFFNPDVESRDISKQTDEFRPSADKGKGGVYQAIIRLIPWWKDPKYGSINDKWVCYLQDPLAQRGRYIDCPSSIGKPSPLQDMFWKLKKSESVQMQKLASNFSRRHSYSSLVQVIKDDNNPELEGKILVWRYGVKVWDKINAEINPVAGIEKNDPFDLYDGKAFAIIVTKVSGYNNYDQSKFVDKKIPLCIPDENGKLIPINKSSDKKEIFEWVKGNSPDLDKYGYKEWDQETLDYVNHVIVSVTGEGVSPEKYANVVSKETPGITSSSINLSDLEEDNSIGLPSFELPEKPKSQGLSGDLDLDELLRGR